MPLNSSIGKIELQLPSFIPLARIRQQDVATHARLAIIGFALDFHANKVLHAATEAVFIPLGDGETATSFCN